MNILNITTSGHLAAAIVGAIGVLSGCEYCIPLLAVAFLRPLLAPRTAGTATVATGL